MDKDRLHITIGREQKVIPAKLDEFTQDDLDNKRPIHGQLHNYPKGYLKENYIEPCKEGRLYTSVEGKPYKMTRLDEEGFFTMEAI